MITTVLTGASERAPAFDWPRRSVASGEGEAKPVRVIGK